MKISNNSILNNDFNFIDIPIQIEKCMKTSDLKNLDEIPLISESLKRAVFQRDNYVCRGCGFRSQKFQKIIPLTSSIFDINSLATVCIFCFQCLFRKSAIKQRSGVLIWLPEVSQTVLHYIARDIYLARITSESMAKKSRKLLDELMNKKERVNKEFNTTDILDFEKMIVTNREDALFISKLENVRLFPLDRLIKKHSGLEFNQFPQILAYWRSKNGPFHQERNFRWLNFLEEKVRSYQRHVTEDNYHDSLKENESIEEFAANALDFAANLLRGIANKNSRYIREISQMSRLLEKLSLVVVSDPIGKYNYQTEETNMSMAIILLQKVCDLISQFESKMKLPKGKGNIISNTQYLKEIIARIKSG